MNLAFPAVFLLLLGLPGVILRYTYRTGPLTTPFTAEAFADQLVWGIVLSIALHATWMFLASTLGYTVDLETVLTLLIVPGHDFTKQIRVAASQPFQICAYFLSIDVGAFLLGYFGHTLVRALQLDLRYQFFRFNNPWWYLLTGERLVWERPEDLDENTSWLVLVSAVIDRGGTSFLYIGIMYDFFFDGSSGELDRLELMWVRRRKLLDDPDPRTRDVADLLNEDTRQPYYRIEGDRLLLKYSQVSDLNVLYVLFEPVDDDTDIELAEEDPSE